MESNRRLMFLAFLVLWLLAVPAFAQNWLGGGSGGVLSSSNNSGFTMQTGITTSGDSAYSIPALPVEYDTSATLTAPRTWTLPAASGLISGQVLRVFDVVSAVSATNTLTISRTSSDTIGFGLTSVVMSSPRSSITLSSDGVSNWRVLNASYAPAFSAVGMTLGANSEIAAVQLPYAIYLPGNGANPNSTASCETANSDTYICKCAATTVMSFIFSASTTPSSITTPSGATQTCAAGNRFACFVSGTPGQPTANCSISPVGFHL